MGGARAAAEHIARPRPPRRARPRRRAAGAAARRRTRTASRAAGCAATARRSRRSASRSPTSASWSARRASTAGSPRSSTRPGRTASARPPSWPCPTRWPSARCAPLRDLRLDVPGDVSVVGFDDIDLAPHVDPPLTTVHQPIRRKGEEAVRLLLSVVERRDLAKPEHRRLETRLIVRGSTGPVPTSPGGGGRGPRLRSERRADPPSSVRLATHGTYRGTAAQSRRSQAGTPARPVGRPPADGNRIGTDPDRERRQRQR